MDIKQNIIGAIAGVLILVIGIAIGGGFSEQQKLGGYTSGYWDSADGYYVDGTAVIDGNGAIIAASTVTISGETQTQTLVQGGSLLTVYGTTTLTAAQVCDYSVIEVGLLADAVATLTLPSATTLKADCLDTQGDHKSVLVRDIATSTLALTILAGADIDLEGDDANADVLAAGTSAELEFWYTSTTTVVIRPFTDVD